MTCGVLVLQVQAGTVLQPTDLNPRSLVMQRYALGIKDAMGLALKRQWLFFLRNKAFIIFRLMQVRAFATCATHVTLLLLFCGCPVLAHRRMGSAWVPQDNGSPGCSRFAASAFW
jgi:hypothetical protein